MNEKRATDLAFFSDFYHCDLWALTNISAWRYQFYDLSTAFEQFCRDRWGEAQTFAQKDNWAKQILSQWVLRMHQEYETIDKLSDFQSSVKPAAAYVALSDMRSEHLWK